MNNLKKIYWDIKLSDTEVEKSWQELKGKIESRPKVSFPYLRYGIISFCLVTVFLGSLVGLTDTAAPGTTFYPMKLLSDKITGKVLRKPEIPVERRAKEIIEVSRQDPIKVEQASEEYNKALDEAEKEVKENEDKKEQLSNSLNKQEELFKKEIKENSRSEEKIKKVLEKTNNIKEKLKKNKKKKT
ncbi:MAG: hypothetical protein NUV73_01565 [Candidatus Daviesbacteria bacterium]|nr:hypothetical protein [Candidatus Daviesbacteria bacterium]